MPLWKRNTEGNSHLKNTCVGPSQELRLERQEAEKEQTKRKLAKEGKRYAPETC
jgi:hypothetical protein